MALTDNRIALEALRAKAIELPDANSGELKVATGNISSLASAVTISGLGFKPLHVFLQTALNGKMAVSAGYERLLAKQIGLYTYQSRAYHASTSSHYIYSGNVNSLAAITITDDGFNVAALSSKAYSNAFVYVVIGI